MARPGRGTGPPTDPTTGTLTTCIDIDGAVPSCPIARTPITINARAISRWLVIVSVALTALSLASDAFVLSRDRAPGLAAQRVVDLFDLDAEANAPAFFATILLAAAAALLGIIARHRWSDGSPDALQWGLLAILFFALSFDEAASLHETMIGPFRRRFPDNRFVYFGWVVPGTVFVLVVGGYFLRFVMNLDRLTRNRFIVAGTVFVGGALGLEVVEGYIASGIGEENWTYVIALSAQELLEMVGVILFIDALLAYLRDLTTGIDLAWSTPTARADTERIGP